MEKEVPTRRSRWLGLFVVFQIGYLTLSNGMQFIPRMRVPEQGDYVLEFQREGRFTSNNILQGLANTTGHVIDRWAEVSGQTQGWKMFCPYLPDRSVFPVVELEWYDGHTQRIESRYVDVNSAIRAPLFAAREHHRQANNVTLAWILTPEKVASASDGLIEDHLIFAEARIRTIQLFLRQAAEHNKIDNVRANYSTLILQFATKPPVPLKMEERPFVRLDLRTGDWEVYHPVERRFERPTR